MKKLKCPECGSFDVIKIGFVFTRAGKKQQYQCKKCGRKYRGEVVEE